jgi:hypothetical protein
MTPRERILAAGIAVALLLGAGGFFFYQFVFAPLQNREGTIRFLSDEIDRKGTRIREVLADKPRLDRARLLSLPADEDLARREYEKFLSALARKSGFAPGSFSVVPKPVDAKSSPTIPGKGAVYTRLTFTVLAHGSLASMVKMLDEFYRTSLLHEIKSLAVQRPLTGGTQQADELDVNLTIEALIVAGANSRPYLLPNVDPRVLILELAAGLRRAPSGLASAVWSAGPAGVPGPGYLAQPPRRYASIVAKNVFLGDTQATEAARGEPVDVTRFVHLTDITHTARRWEAFLYDRSNNRTTRLRAEDGFDSFRILDDAGEPLVRGRVLSIQPRDLIIRVADQVYAVHVGQSVEESLKKPLSDDELRAFGVARADERRRTGS